MDHNAIAGAAGIRVRTLAHCSKVIEEVIEIIGLSLLLVTLVFAGFAQNLQIQVRGSYRP